MEFIQHLILEIVDSVGLGRIASLLVGAFIAWLFTYRREARIRKLYDEAISARDEIRNKLDAREEEIRGKQSKVDELERVIKARGITVTEQQKRINDILEALRGNEEGLWLTHKERQLPFDDFNARIERHKPVIIVTANNKGGVGKTTVTGNLLAYFDKSGKRVLAIDLDYQGSLTTMLRAAQPEDAREVRERRSDVNKLLEPNASLASLWEATRPLGRTLPRSSLVPSFYELALLEDRLLVEWLLQEGDDDARYRLASVLLQDEIREKYDVILIDVPPRMTTGTINALCASTHVLIPAIFNAVSAEPVDNFLRTAKALMDELNPNLTYLGVLETMSPPDTQFKDPRARARADIQNRLKSFSPPISILKSHVPRRTGLADGVGYLKTGHDGSEAKHVFDALGAEIERSVGL